MNCQWAKVGLIRCGSLGRCALDKDLTVRFFFLLTGRLLTKTVMASKVRISPYGHFNRSLFQGQLIEYEGILETFLLLNQISSVGKNMIMLCLNMLVSTG